MKEPSDKQYAKWCRETLIDHLEKDWGKLILKGYWILANDGMKFLAICASLSEDRFWYGVTHHDWQNWDDNCYLIFLMRDGEQVSYVMMDPVDSRKLLDKINPGKNSKIINVRMPSSGKLYIQAWEDFQFAARIVIIGKMIRSLPAKIQAAIEKLSPEKIAKLLAKISG